MIKFPIASILSCVLLALSGCGFDVNTVQGSGVGKSETRALDPITSVQVLGSGVVTITAGAPEQSVTVDT
ncbi:MAG: hypothetical protein ACREJC_07245, partial [Tepidisphaeraceae bacterium]